MSVRVCGSRRDGQYVERMVYSMLLRQKPSRMALQDLKEESLLVSTTRCDFLKRDKDFVRRVSFFFSKVRSQFVARVSVYVANFVSLFLQREHP